MSDEEDESVSEGFSASEDEWKPGKHDGKHDDGESSDDDDSDFEESIIAGVGSAKSQGSSRKRETKGQLKGTSGGVAKKRKPMGQSLRARLYNKYRPPPKTLQTAIGSDSPRASTSGTASKNALTPNEVSGIFGDQNDDGSSSDSSVGNHLVNPADLDLRSSFFNVDGKTEVPAPPVFDCNAGIANLSESDSEAKQSEANDDEEKISKAFDFRNLLEKANSLERMKEQIAKKSGTRSSKAKNDAMDDVTTLLALGENQHLKNKKTSQDDDEDDEDDDADADEDAEARAPSKLSKTKSTRIKRHKKTRPASTVISTGGAGDSDDSDWEEVADDDPANQELTYSENGLEIFVERGTRKRTKEEKTQEELEMAFRRRLNRDLKDQQMILHKTSLLCLFGRSFHYNRLLNHTDLMQTALKMLPGAKAYPRETGTELKYFQSFVTWFKTTIKLTTPNLYPNKEEVGKTSADIREGLIAQIKRKEARCKQDMIMIFIALLRAMAIQCRLIVNMQPLPLKPSQQDLLPIKLKPEVKKTAEKNEKLSKAAALQKNTEKLNIIKKLPTATDKEQENNKSEDKKKLEKSNNSDKKFKDRQKNISNQKDGKSRSTRHNSSNKASEIVDNDCMSYQKLNVKDKGEEKSTKNKPKKKNSDALEEMLERNFTTISEFDQNPFKEQHISSDKKENNKVKQTVSTETTKQSTNKRTKADPKKSSSSQKINNNQSKRLNKEISEDLTKAKKPKNSVDNIATSLPKPLSVEIEQPTSSTNSKVNSLCLSASDSGINFEISEKERHVLLSPKKLAIPNAISGKKIVCPSTTYDTRARTRSRSRSISPRPLISTEFLETKTYKERISPEPKSKQKEAKTKTKETKPKISTNFLQSAQPATGRILRSRQNLTANNVNTLTTQKDKLNIPQLDGADDDVEFKKAKETKKRSHPQKVQKKNSKSKDSDEDFHPSPQKQPKRAPILPKTVQQLRKDRRVISTDNDSDNDSKSPSESKKHTAADMWAEVWSDVENRWICIDLFRGKLDSVESIRKSASSHLAYVYAFQNDLSLKDVTARYCQNWAAVIRKERVPSAWLDTAISSYYGIRTDRDIREDDELRRIHEEKEMPKSIAEFKDHPLYALERHLLKFQAIYPPNAPTFGFTSRGDPIYSRDCVHVLHAREIWLKQARTVKLGEKPYKIVKARPKWDRITQSIVKDLPLEIFGHWQTEDYEPPTAENGIVPRNAYGNVELFKECMLPKKTVHIRLPGLNRICKKLGVDCANAVIGFDFHQGSCHPTFDGFIVCEEFADQVTAAWYQDQEDQDRKEQEKYEARVYGNWKKLIRGLLIRERLKKKYNF